MSVSALKYLGPPIVLGSMAWLISPTVSAEEKKTERTESPSDVYIQPPSNPSPVKPDTTELERGINKCRQEFQPIKLAVREFVDKSTCFIHESTTIVRENVDYLRSASQEVQVGAIAVGALAGSLLGIRRGKFKKLWYGTLGGVGMAALIYPAESKIVVSEGYKAAKCYGTIAYNFILGRQT